MKRYGHNKATEFTGKQINIIYAKAKNGELKIEKWVMSNLYDLSDFYGYDDNGSVEFCEREILNILNNVFSGDIARAQERINQYTERHFSLASKKRQASFNRELIK